MADDNLPNRDQPTLHGQADREAPPKTSGSFPSISSGIVILFFLGLVLTLFIRKKYNRMRKQTFPTNEGMEHFSTFFEKAGVATAMVDLHSRKYLRVNTKYCAITEYTSHDLQNLTLIDITFPKDRDTLEDHIEQISFGKVSESTLEHRCIRKDKQVIWVSVSLSPLLSSAGKPSSLLVVTHDITTRKQAEEKQVFSSKIFENSIEGIVVTDPQGTIIHVNPAFSMITGYGPEEVIGRNPRILKSQKHTPAFYEKMWRRLTEEGKWAGQIWNRRKDGEAYPEWMTISAVKNQQGETINYVSIFHDISELKRQQDALEHQAQHDALTGLPNRILINDRLEMALARMKRNKTKLALIFLDLDNFKHINDAFGHRAGDNLLIDVATRLNHLLRTGDTMARLGGDEFLILLSEVETIDDVSLIAVRLIESLQQPFYHDQIEYVISTSIGIAVAPEDSSDPGNLVKFADNAMYRAKSLGRNNYQFFTPELDIQAHLRISKEIELRKALEHGDFELFYQPLVRIDDGKIVSAEALIRWRHEGRLVPPIDFLALAEDSDLILPLGEWALNAAACQLKDWQNKEYDIGLLVHISSRQVADQYFASLLKKLLAEKKLAPNRLYLELTESMIISDLTSVQNITKACGEMGVKFYLDNFGEGYSSLSDLNRLPLHGLKISPSFIKTIIDNPNTRALVTAFVALAKVLNMDIIAKGVETCEQKELLGRMGPMLIQGYLVSPPVPAEQFLEILEKERQGHSG